LLLLSLHLLANKEFSTWVADKDKAGSARPTKSGSIAVSLIQSNFFRQGNFEVIARIGDHLVHFWRDNDDPHLMWNGPFLIPNSNGVSGNPVIVQSNYFNKGNFEVVVLLASGGLAHFWRDNDSPNLLWHGPYIFGTNAGEYRRAFSMLKCQRYYHLRPSSNTRAL
jgi:hypothetical protein